jgi:hypothetical protein
LRCGYVITVFFFGSGNVNPSLNYDTGSGRLVMDPAGYGFYLDIFVNIGKIMFKIDFNP